MTEVKLEEERHNCSAVVQEVKEEPDCGGVQGPHEAAPSLDRIKEEPEEVQIKQESIRAFPVIVCVRSVKEESVLHETVKQEKTQDTVGAETETSSDTDDSGDWTAKTMNHAAVLQEMEPAQPLQTPHTLEKRHSCDQCGKGFTASKYLKQHKIFHSEKKPHQCDQCGKAFRISPHLRQHARTHTGERPYECERCDKAFTQPGPLKRHLRIHTGEKPYGCDECKKTFNQQGNLTQHKKTHGRLKLFRCDQCGKVFSKTGYLKAHMKLHTGEKL